MAKTKDWWFYIMMFFVASQVFTLILPSDSGSDVSDLAEMPEIPEAYDNDYNQQLRDDYEAQLVEISDKYNEEIENCSDRCNSGDYQPVVIVILLLIVAFMGKYIYDIDRRIKRLNNMLKERKTRRKR